MNNKPIIEDISSDELSSEDVQPYLPSANIESLEPDEKVYSLLEYISLDWPSQSITKSNDRYYVATNPEKETPNIVEFNFDNTKNYAKFEDVKITKKDVNESYNRIRTHNNLLFCLADTSLDIYHVGDLVKQATISGEFGYGISISDKIACGYKNGTISIYDYNLSQISTYRHHKKSVESIAIADNVLYSGSCDHTSKGIDLRSNEIIFEHKDSCDINAIDICDNKLLLGLDDGTIFYIDLRNNAKEKIKWHSTPISFIKWKNSTEFVSCSDEQVAIWDTTFEEEWEYHRYLRFVHQGQKFYKDVCFDDDIYVVTSFDGLCFFKLAL